MKNWIVLLIAVFMVNACFLTVDASERGNGGKAAREKTE